MYAAAVLLAFGVVYGAATEALNAEADAVSDSVSWPSEENLHRFSREILDMAVYGNENEKDYACTNGLHPSGPPNVENVRKAMDCIQQARSEGKTVVALPKEDGGVGSVHDKLCLNTALADFNADAFAAMYQIDPTFFKGKSALRGSLSFFKTLSLKLRDGLPLDVLFLFNEPFASRSLFQAWIDLVDYTKTDDLHKYMALLTPTHAQRHMNVILDATRFDVFGAVFGHPRFAILLMVYVRNCSADRLEQLRQRLMHVDLTRMTPRYASGLARVFYLHGCRDASLRFMRHAFMTMASYHLPALLCRTKYLGLRVIVEPDVVARHGAPWVMAVLFFEQERRKHSRQCSRYAERVNAALHTMLSDFHVHDLDQCINAAISNQHPAIAFFVQSIGLVPRDLVRGAYNIDLPTARSIVDDMVQVSMNNGARTFESWDMDLLRQAALGGASTTDDAIDFIGALIAPTAN